MPDVSGDQVPHIAIVGGGIIGNKTANKYVIGTLLADLGSGLLEFLPSGWWIKTKLF